MHAIMPVNSPTFAAVDWLMRNNLEEFGFIFILMFDCLEMF